MPGFWVRSLARACVGACAGLGSGQPSDVSLSVSLPFLPLALESVNIASGEDQKKKKRISFYE